MTEQAAPATWTPPAAHGDVSAMSAEQAREAQQALTQDKGFSAAFSAGEAGAKAHWQKLTDAVLHPAGEQPAAAVVADPTADPGTRANAARSELARLRKDGEWIKKYFAGDLDARATFQRLTEAAAAVSPQDAANAPGANLDAYKAVSITVQPESDLQKVQAANTAWRETALELQLPPTLAKALVQRLEFMEYATRGWSERQYMEHAATNEAALQAEWGDQFDARMDAIRDYLGKATKHGQALRELLEISGGASDPWILRTLWNIANTRRPAA